VGVLTIGPKGLQITKRGEQKMADLDLSTIEASIAAMSPEEIRAQLTAIKTKQKITQKKYYNPETAKRARVKKAQEINALVAKAKELGIYQEVLDEANSKADEALGAAEGEEEAA